MGFLFACAKEPLPRPRPPEEKPPKPRAVEPLPTPPTGPLSPKRGASQRLVQIGEDYMARGQLAKAVQTFQEAINVDHDNGVAYYFMGKGMYLNRDYQAALGVLDQAEVLLTDFPEWLDEVLRLRLYVEEAIEYQYREQKRKKEQFF